MASNAKWGVVALRGSMAAMNRDPRVESTYEFFREELAYDHLTISFCLECCRAVAVSDDTSVLEAAEDNHIHCSTDIDRCKLD